MNSRQRRKLWRKKFQRHRKALEAGLFSRASDKHLCFMKVRNMDQWQADAASCICTYVGDRT